MSDNDATQARQDFVANVDEIIEHVINANMLSMPYDVYSALFDAVDGLGVKLENLQDENDKLREIIADLEELLPKSERLCIHETVKAIAEDNAKLREMVADMWRSAMLKCDFTERYAFADEFVDRMRELGIEVAE